MTGSGSAVVTGAASGIGRAVAEHLVNDGWAVAALDRDERGLDHLNASLPNDRIMVQTTDIASSRDVARAFSAARDELGAIGAVVAAAGIWTPGTVAELSDDSWSRAIAVNLTGTFITAREAVTHLRTSGHGSFVAIASDVGLQGSQSCAAYVAAKHGVVGLVRSMALDFGAIGIRSNAVCPGFVETGMTEEIFRESDANLRRARRDEVPLGRFASAAEIAAVVGSLLSPASTFVNGAALVVDGGATAGYYTPRDQ